MSENIFTFPGSESEGKTENKIKAFNAWEQRVGKLARHKTICEASIILYAQQKENDEVVYLLFSEGRLICITEEQLLDEYQVVD